MAALAEGVTLIMYNEVGPKFNAACAGWMAEVANITDPTSTAIIFESLFLFTRYLAHFDKNCL
jgi:hypothetical protein